MALALTYKHDELRGLTPAQLQQAIREYQHAYDTSHTRIRAGLQLTRDRATAYYLMQTDPVLQAALAGGDRKGAEKYLQQQLGSGRWRIEPDGEITHSNMPSKEWWIAAAAVATVGTVGAIVGGGAAAAGAGSGALPVTSALPALPTATMAGAGGAGGAGVAGVVGAVAGGGIPWGDILKYGLAGAGTALDIFGQLKAAQHNKELAEFNAGIAEQRAADAIARGAEEEDRWRMGVRTLIGSQRAGFAGQNVDVDIGSPVNVVADTAHLGELDALTIRTNARREAWGYEVDAENFRRGGDAAASQAKFGVANTVLGTATSLLTARYGWGRQA